ncbi:YqhG family protein [Piscibacillus sp. B03]|uniref:YqhG family protein n=1 Tax=Piscibacillus sp. B03 TaxID=3457430 RepID=UPI003FCDD659
MNQAEIHDFLVQFFYKRNATIEYNDTGILKVKLTEELDQRLMNRPFYWQYVKKLGYKGDPMSVTFISDENKKAEKGEWIHYGSPRLEQLFQVILEEGKYTELFEQTPTEERQPLHPWFVCNLMVRYQGAYTHDEMVSVGVYLINGTMRFKMMDELLDEAFSKIIPDLSYKIPPIISSKRAVMMINEEIKHRIKEKSLSFAKQSEEIYQKEMDMTNQLFQEREEEDGELLKENIEKQIYDRLYPKVHLKLINCGLFYITEARSKKMMSVH